MSSGWRHADFAGRIGEDVTLRPMDRAEPGGDVLATVAACSDVARTPDYVSFRVTFLAGPGAPRTQALFLVEATGREPEPLFLVPVRERDGFIEYEAVFNQPVEVGSGT